MEIFTLTPPDLDKFSHLFPASLLKELPADELMLGCAEGEPPAAAGVLLAHVEELELMIDWLYVDEAFRRKGGAREMLTALMQAAAESEELDAASVIFTEEMDGMAEFLRAMGFLVAVRGKDKGFVTLLGKFPRFKNPRGSQGTFAALGEVEPGELARFASVLNDGIIPDTAVDLPFRPEAYLPESMVCLEEGKIRALCLFSGDENGLTIDWVYNNCSVSTTFIDLFNEAMSRLKKRFPPETKLVFASVNEGVENIVEKQVPIESRAEIYVGTYALVRED